jgi:carbamoylphosphate synthase large subunit
MRKRILLVDTNFSAKPIYDYLVKTGAEVYVVGGRPQDTLAKSVENYVNLDYSNVSEVKSLIKSLRIDFLVPGGNDVSYRVCSEINSDTPFYNIDPVAANDIVNSKEKFREFSTDLGLHVPHIVEPDKVNDFLPVIVKPVDGYSGHGMTVIHRSDRNEIENAVKLAKKLSKSKRYLIEEFVPGQLYSHSAFIIDGEITIDFIVEEHCVVNPYVVDTSRVVFDFDERILGQIRADITSLAKKLHLTDGLVHTQFICNGSSFWIIEVTRRCPGDLYSMLIEYSTGFPYAEYYARPFLNQELDFSEIKLNDKFIIRHTITQPKESYFYSLSFNLPTTIEKLVPLTLSGDKVRRSPFSRIGLIFFSTNTEKETDDLLKKILSRELYSIRQ